MTRQNHDSTVTIGLSMLKLNLGRTCTFGAEKSLQKKSP